MQCAVWVSTHLCPVRTTAAQGTKTTTLRTRALSFRLTGTPHENSASAPLVLMIQVLLCSTCKLSLRDLAPEERSAAGTALSRDPGPYLSLQTKQPFAANQTARKQPAPMEPAWVWVCAFFFFSHSKRFINPETLYHNLKVISTRNKQKKLCSLYLNIDLIVTRGRQFYRVCSWFSQTYTNITYFNLNLKKKIEQTVT